MFTSSITSQANGVATVVFTHDTGETETYTEQITVSDAVFATEEAPFIPPVYEIVTHTRQKLVTQTETITFTDSVDLTAKVAARTTELNESLTAIPFVPTPSAEELERNTWLNQWAIYKKAKNAMQELADAGFTPTAEETTRFETLKTWVGTNRKPEYSQYI